MANRNFDSRVIIQRLQNRVYSRNLYNNNTTGQRIINNPQTTDGNSSRYVPYHEGAQTEYFRTLSGTTEISPGGIQNIPPYPPIPTNPSSPTVPSAPTSLLGVAADSTVMVTFTQGSDGGSAIINYQYSTDNGITFTPCSPAVTASPVIINGLTNGVTYYIRLKAVNSIGASAASDALVAVPATVPAAPTSLVATSGNTQLSISFTQGSDGGGAITNYEYSTDNGVTFTPFSPSVTTSPVVITGLTNGTTYNVKLKAVNFIGESAASSAVSGTPATVPDAPTSLVATPGNGQVSVAFTQGSDGGSPILNYYYSIDNGVSFAEFSPEVTVSPVVITGLTNGTTYEIRLKAINYIGLSNTSDAVSATPIGPTILSFTAVGSTTWTAPDGITSIEYLVVGGGGGSGGGYDTGAGGGGGGGMVLAGTVAVTSGTTYNIVVGDGGAGGTSVRTALPEIPGSPGGNSSFDTIIALGGSGGYPSRQAPNGVSVGGSSAIDPSTASGGGNGGGNASRGGGGSGGGGGGSLGAGGDGTSGHGGTGGNGTPNDISGSSITYGAGGNGGIGNTNNTGNAGTSNTGNGGNGSGATSSSYRNGTQGGSGIVVISYSA